VLAAGASAIADAARCLRDGGLVAFPTETVYGLGADAANPAAVARIFAAKRRPRDVSLPLLVSGVEQALSVSTAVPALALELMARYWPGPLTIVIPAKAGLAADLGDDDMTVGVRAPGHPVPLALCAAVGPLATTSANRHGEPPMTTAADVDATFGDALPLVLDGGVCAGSPSTVVDCTGEELKLLREGRIPWADLRGAGG
jgi:L-threonylcarbamoyladenylate synthase